MAIPTLERELRLMIKTMTNLGYSEWTSMSDEEVRTGAPRVYCSFLRFLLDAHPNVLKQLLTPPTVASLPAALSSGKGRSSSSSVLCATRDNIYAPRPGHPQRSSINKHIAATFGFHAPSTASHCASVGGDSAAPRFIVETEDARFMQRLLQFVLPEFFNIAQPMTVQQFFRSSGGFVLHKAKLVRNVAALFQRREAELIKRDLRAAEEGSMLQRMEEAQRRRLHYYHAAENSRVVDPVEVLARGLQPPPLLDKSSSENHHDCSAAAFHEQQHPELQTHVTARQRASMLEQRSKAALQSRLAELNRQHRDLNHISRAEAVLAEQQEQDRLRRAALRPSGIESPLTLISSASLARHPPSQLLAATSPTAVSGNRSSKIVSPPRSGSVGPDGGMIAFSALGVGTVTRDMNIILYDQAQVRDGAPDEELVEERPRVAQHSVSGRVVL